MTAPPIPMTSRSRTLVWLAALTACAAPSTVPDEPLPALVAFLREAHPDPHRFLPAAALDERLQVENAAVGPSPEPIALARGASRLAAAIADAHVAVGLGPEAGEGPQLPFLLVRAGDRVFLDASEPSFPIGTEVLEVEGRPVDAFLDALAAMATVDGDRPEVRRAEAQRRLSFLGLMELGPRAHYELMVRRPGASTEELRLPATDRAGLARLASTRYSAPRWGAPPTTDAPWTPSLVRLDDDTRLLRLPSFGSNDETTFTARASELFDEVPSDARLVIDLRGNEGGNRLLGVAVLRRLLDRPFAQWRRVSTRIRAIPAAFRDHVSFPIVPESALTTFPGERRGDVWVFDGDPLADRMIPSPNPHRGRLIVFVDDATSSAAVEMLAALLAHREDVVVIGTETQGGCDRHTGEMPVVFQVESLAVLVSLFEIDLVAIPGCRPGHGAEPHVPVAYTADDYLAGEDPFVTALQRL
jgi:hypothetical protein